MILCFSLFSLFHLLQQLKTYLSWPRLYVQNGKYQRVAVDDSLIYVNVFTSNHENFRIIAADIRKNNLSRKDIFQQFFHQSIPKSIAFHVNTKTADLLAVGNKFISKDLFVESMAAMMVRKDFCCKTLIEKFVHKLMATGLYLKYYNDNTFLLTLPLLLKYTEKNTS